MTGRVAALARHPVKGFTPEPLDVVTLTEDAHFPGDRMFAVEDGPSGFDPADPQHISKMRFTVLARLPEVAAVRTRYDDDTGELIAWHPDFGEITADMEGEAGRQMFAIWLKGDRRERMAIEPETRGSRRIRLKTPAAMRASVASSMSLFGGSVRFSRV